jgi:hypothetical protein
MAGHGYRRRKPAGYRHRTARHQRAAYRGETARVETLAALALAAAAWRIWHQNLLRALAAA